MASKEEPDKIKIVKPDSPEVRWQERESAWDSVLTGKALRKRHGIDEQVDLFAAIERMRREGKLLPAKVGALKGQVKKNG